MGTRARSAVRVLWALLWWKGANGATNLVPNGDFEAEGEWASPWGRVAGASVVTEDGNRFLRIGRGGIGVPLRIPLDPSWWTLRLSLRMRVHGVEPGDENWKDARLAMSFHAADGSRVGEWPRVPNARGTTGWFSFEHEYVIPRGAVTLALSAANYGRAGQADFDDIWIVVQRSRPSTPANASLPAGFPLADPWDPSEAERLSTATRGRICLNGLWRFRPWLPGDTAKFVPEPEPLWGWFKVPGIWPRGYDGAGPAPQVVLCSSALDPRDYNPSTMEQAWYRRRIHVPADWAGRRIQLRFTMLQTHATAFLDGQAVGEVWFPGGQLDLTAAVQPGRDHELTLLVTARPLKAGELAFQSPEEASRRRAEVRLRGVTGDVFLESVPSSNVITDVRVAPSVREARLGLDIGVENAAYPVYRVRAVVSHAGRIQRTFEWEMAEVRAGRLQVVADWPDAPRWDVDKPENLLDVSVALLDANGTLLDESLPVRFGFRDVRIEGREILLNGTPIRLRALHVASANGPAHIADAEGVRRLIERMRQYGFNFLIQANYNVQPGEVGYLDALLDACDRTGMLLSISLPHVRDFDWKLHEPAIADAYRRLTEWIIRRVQNHPAVILYAMNHNSTGYYGDQNPLKMDGVFDPDRIGREPSTNGVVTRRRARAQAVLAEQIARRIDPSRPMYHHQSGNLGDLYTVNIYLNWAPLQERNDWLAHWSVAGRKPMFFVEWGLPHIASWSSYRGPMFIWRHPALQCAWVTEFAAAYVGERAYDPNPGLRAVLDREEELWRAGQPFHWWQLSSELSTRDLLHGEVVARFAAANWRSHRAWGISAILPWDQKSFWTRVKPTPIREHPARFRDLQRPGIVPDFLMPEGQYLYDPGPSDHFQPSAIGQVFARWNQPLCAFIGGDPSGHGSQGPSFASDVRFTEASHLVEPGTAVRKSLVLLNDLRREVGYRCRWQLGDGVGAPRGENRGRLGPADRRFLPIELRIPRPAPPGELRLRAHVDFDTGETQSDELIFTVLPARSPEGPRRPVRLVDPVGVTATLLRRIGVQYHECSADERTVGAGDVIVIGERALSHPALEGQPLPLLGAAGAGARALIMAQEIDALQRRGFRVNLHALRQWYVRCPDHPALHGLTDAHVSYWRGASTLIPPFLDTPAYEASDPRWLWCGFLNTRVWRAGNLNSVASVLIEKPDRGDWLPLVDGGFDLQFSPLLETTVGAGRLLFCQLEIAHRTQPEPVADRLVRQLLRYLETAPRPVVRRVLVRGDERLLGLLRELNLSATVLPDELDTVSPTLVVLGPGCGSPPRGFTQALETGAHVLALGLSAEELRGWVPEVVARPATPTMCAPLGPMRSDPLLRGISSAELHWRTRPVIAPLSDDGHPALRVLRRGQGAVVICQIAPWHIDADESARLRTTWRRTVWLVSRLLHNLGAAAENPVLARLVHPAAPVAICWTNGWRGMVDPKNEGRSGGWWKMDFNDSSWPEVVVPGPIHLFEPQLNAYTGFYWYRRAFDMPPGFEGTDLTLELGPTGAPSWVWVNGQLVNEITWSSHPETCHVVSRSVTLPRDRLQSHGNRIVVLIQTSFEAGGILTPPYLVRPGPWLDTYLQRPIAEDDPYRYYRW